MYEEHIRAAARSMAENMQRSPVPMYGKGLRLPDKGAGATHGFYSSYPG